jgi:hypothetical protein
MTIVIVWAISVVTTETMEVFAIVVGKLSRLLEASVGVAADGLEPPVVRNGDLGFGSGGGGYMSDVVFRAGHPDFQASRGAIQTCCRESMPFQMTAGSKGSRAYASDLMRFFTFLATDPWTISLGLYWSSDMRYAARPATVGAAKPPHPHQMLLEIIDIGTYQRNFLAIWLYLRLGPHNEVHHTLMQSVRKHILDYRTHICQLHQLRQQPLWVTHLQAAQGR